MSKIKDWYKIHRMAKKIDRLCQLLDDTEEPSGSSDLPVSEHKQKQSIKLTLFRLDQRQEELDRKLDGLNLASSAQIGDCFKQIEEIQTIIKVPKGASLMANRKVERFEFITDKDSPQSKRAEELKRQMTIQEVSLEDLTARIAEVENQIHVLEPENIRALIKSIAELLVQAQKKEVTEVVNDIKGTQMESVKLVDNIKEEIKNMDERFIQNMKRKIERKDLYYTKSLLQRKVKYMATTIK